MYFTADGALWLLIALALAPDLSMVGYFAGPRIGGLTYNVVHTYVLSLTLGGVGAWVDAPLAIQVAAVWTGHIGLNRLFGYDLKFPTGFKETRLSKRPAPTTAFTESE